MTRIYYKILATDIAILMSIITNRCVGEKRSFSEQKNPFTQRIILNKMIDMFQFLRFPRLRLRKLTERVVRILTRDE